MWVACRCVRLGTFFLTEMDKIRYSKMWVNLIIHHSMYGHIQDLECVQDHNGYRCEIFYNCNYVILFGKSEYVLNI